MDVLDKGKGVVTLISVEKDDLICEYCGDLVIFQEAKQREERYLEECGDSEYQGYIFFFNYSGNKLWYVYYHTYNITMYINHITIYCIIVLVQQWTTKIDLGGLLIILNSTT